jgi:type VI secretion system protein ImpF
VAGLTAQERLQPSLLDRLTDNEPGSRSEPLEARVLSKKQLREAVLRDLSWLFNAVCEEPDLRHPDRERVRMWHEAPLARDSVLNFGIPPLSGQSVSVLQFPIIEEQIRQAILRFEPRLLPETLKVVALEATHVLDTHNMIEFEIRGHMWAQPVPLEVLLRTKLDLEAGQVEVRDATGSAPSKVF